MSRALPALAPGDRLWVVAPAGPVDPARLESGMARLRALGLEVDLAPHARGQEGFLAGPDRERADDLEAAFADAGARGVIYARGGYGTTRLLPMLDLEAMARAGKLLVGFSDATALGLALSRREPFPFLHGPTVSDLGGRAPGHDEESLTAGLFGRHAGGRQRLSGLTPLRPGRASGIVMGGCLSLVTALVGTPYEPSLDGRILFLEDVQEEPFRLDRMLNHLRTAGRLERLAGLIFGQFHACVPRDAGRPSWSTARVLAEFARSLPCPVVSDLPAGHGPGRLTIPLGRPADLDAGAGTVVFHHS